MIHVSVMWCLASQPAILRGKNFNAGHYNASRSTQFFIASMFIGTIDFYHFMQISLTLTLPGVTKSTRSKTYWLHFLTRFSSDQNEISSVDEAIQAEHPETTFDKDL